MFHDGELIARELQPIVQAQVGVPGHYISRSIRSLYFLILSTVFHDDSPSHVEKQYFMDIIFHRLYDS